MQCKRRAHDAHVVRTDRVTRYDLRAVARPPLRPAAFFCALVPPCDELLREEPEPEDLPPRLEDPEELAILAARCFDMPLSFSASYCFSFLTLLLLLGMDWEYPWKSHLNHWRVRIRSRSRPTTAACSSAPCSSTCCHDDAAGKRCSSSTRPTSRTRTAGAGSRRRCSRDSTSLHESVASRRASCSPNRTTTPRTPSTARPAAGASTS